MPIIDAYMYYTAYRFQLSAQVNAILTSVTVLWKTINLSSLRLMSMPLLYLAGNLILVHEITRIDLAKKQSKLQFEDCEVCKSDGQIYLKVKLTKYIK